MELWDNVPKLTHMLWFVPGSATRGLECVAPAYIASQVCGHGRAYVKPWAENSDAEPVFVEECDVKAKARELAGAKGEWGEHHVDKGLEEKRRLDP
jgi:hypothetical protein